jgi:hypothetical protein
MSGSFRSRSTQATAVNSTSGTTVMDSVVVGQYDNDHNAIPLHEYQVEIPASSFSPKTHQMRHSISVFPSTSADRARTPDSKAETIYEISKAESHEGLILQYVTSHHRMIYLMKFTNTRKQSSHSDKPDGSSPASPKLSPVALKIILQ